MPIFISENPTHRGFSQHKPPRKTFHLYILQSIEKSLDSKRKPLAGDTRGKNGSSVDGSNCLSMDRAKEDLADPIINTTL